MPDHVTKIHIGERRLVGDLCRVPGARGLVVFAHGSGSSRLSARNRRVAQSLQQRGLDTLLFDLLTEQEASDRANVFDIETLAARVMEALDELRDAVPSRRIGLFGASTGAAAALVAAARQPDQVFAVVSRGGRPDLARAALPQVQAPTLLIVGAADVGVLELNREAYALMRCEKQLELVPRATHLFEEAGALERVGLLAGDWFVRHLGGPV
ncbi:dienelactone hydrolase family protein [Caldimonas sp. KR1-144]|uniref:dienelactone hydrolase family protein n=1 Tax=Caldimonas sp. KR1-144 TaxID=3400911 RepID=UPI003C08A08D